MIRPNMATMLGFLATDACVDASVVQQLARAIWQTGSFNRVTIDGDTSTNDSFVVVATNKAAHAPITSLDSAEGQALLAAMLDVAQKLAQAIVRDGEGRPSSSPCAWRAARLVKSAARWPMPSPTRPW